jgi:hypothetical protein
MLSHQLAGFFLYPIRAFVWPRRSQNFHSGVQITSSVTPASSAVALMLSSITRSPGAFIGRIRTRFKYFGNPKFFVQEFLEVIGSRRRGYGR